MREPQRTAEMRMFSDVVVLTLMHGALIVFALVACGIETNARVRASGGWRHRFGRRREQGDAGVRARFEHASVSIRRGDKGMGLLAGLFATFLGVFVFAVDAADAATGYKSGLILLDFLLLGYLFFFNNWFRNFAIGHASAREKETR